MKTIPFLDTPLNGDAAGLVASVACAVHCAAMPLVIGYLPMLGLTWLADPSFHRVMAIACFAIALAAFVPGWRKHGSLAPTLFGSVGVGLLSLAAFGLEGSCCPSCAAKPAATNCTDPDCDHCVVVEPAAPEPDTALAAGPSDWYIPLITPLGGVFLIAGHLSNHRQSCACCKNGGCTTESSETLAG